VLAANYSTVGDESPERALRIAWNGRGTLSMRDRAYVVARAGASYPAVADLVTQVQGWHNAVKAAPDRAEAWYQLGEQQFLYADFLTEEDSRAQAAKSFEKALSLDSTFTPALERLVELRARSSDTAATRRLIPLLASRQPTDRTDYVRWRAAIALGDSAGVRALRARLPRFSRESITQLFQNAQLDGVGLGDAIQAVRIFSDRGGTADEQGDAAAARYLLALNRGQPHAAAPDLMRAAGTRNYVVPLLQSQAVRDAIWSSGDTAAAVEAVDQLSQTIRETVDPTPADDAPLYVALCAVEQWNLAHGDTRTATFLVRRAKPRRDDRFLADDDCNHGVDQNVGQDQQVEPGAVPVDPAALGRLLGRLVAPDATARQRSLRRQDQDRAIAPGTTARGRSDRSCRE